MIWVGKIIPPRFNEQFEAGWNSLYFKFWMYFLKKVIRYSSEFFIFCWFTSADNIFHNFLELHSTLFKKIFSSQTYLKKFYYILFTLQIQCHCNMWFWNTEQTIYIYFWYVNNVWNLFKNKLRIDISLKIMKIGRFELKYFEKLCPSLVI